LNIADLNCCRKQVELFFKRIERHFRIEAFYRTSENAVNAKTCIAVSVYVLIAIVKKRLTPSRSLKKTRQIFSLILRNNMPLDELPTRIENRSRMHTQMILFD